MSAKVSSRSGSALLIVLGMMSFMLFSGLAFSVYMRYARLPTSFLRRTTISRQLAKAALAEAIEEVDRAIGDNPHPGICKTSIQGQIGNIFDHHVFFGYAEQNMTCDQAAAANLVSGDYLQSHSGQIDFTKSTYGITPDEAISVLTLEGLAYLPPNLINDIRYYSRCTATARWHPFWFDSGRYAYVAVDVSDYFDVNRVLADAPRAASADRRITLAHLFEKIETKPEGDRDVVCHTGSGSGAEKWDAFIDSASNNGAEPFVSLADFNIAWHGNSALSFGGTSLVNPFYNFLTTGYAYGQGTTADSPKAAYYKQLTFVTDSWSPAPKRTDGLAILDLADEANQPFKRSDLESSNKTLDQVLEYGGGKILSDEKYLGSRLCDFTRVALWDYLDRDKMPLSLAVPTCEQVPMICAIQPEFSGSFKIEKATTAERETPASKTEVWKERDVTYSLVMEGAGSDLSGFVAWTYPFLLKGRDAKTNGSNDKFSLDGRVALFLTEDGNGLSARPGHEIAGLYLKNENDVKTGSVVNDTVLTYPFKAASSTDPKTIHGADKTMPVQELPFKAENCHASVKRPMVMLTYRWKQNKQTGQPKDPNYLDGNAITSVKEPSGDKFGLLKKDGKRETDFGFLKNGGSKKVDVNAAVWARVTDANNKTVDLVPACILDDKNLNNVNNTGAAMLFGDTNPYPLLSLKSSGSIELSLAKLNSETGELGTYTLTGQALITGDPRFNHAPENWKVTTGGSGLDKKWYDLEKSYAQQTGKDGDLYMATSDQMCLQSLYELLMLPRIQTDGISKNGVGGNYLGAYSTTYDGKIRTGNETLKDHQFMWRTYQPGDLEEIDDGRIVAGDSGQKVNPYSESTEVLMAALANTPHDWRVASTNNKDVVNLKTEEFNKEYAWNEYSSTEDGRLCWDCLQAFAEDLSLSARNLGDINKAFRELDWSRDPRKLLGSMGELDDVDSDLHAVDKKFLYGFWHDSFAVRQQLFLFFVRAEPMMMGGGVAGQAPPQLGARAVALVWRDPSPFPDAKSSNNTDSNGNAIPSIHRTRVLFYHTFD